MESPCKRILIISGELFYMWMIALSIKALNDKSIEIVNPDIPQAIKSAEKALNLIKDHKPNVLLLDHFLSNRPIDRILGKIKPEDGEGIEISGGINFFYVGEIKPKVISISSRSKEEIKSLYGNRIKHCMEGDMLKLLRCLKEKCLC